MKVNYVLMYGTPYLKYREFETFDDISKFLINKSIVNYSIFEKMSDKKEVEMIYLNNDIRVLEDKIDKAIEFCNRYLSLNLDDFDSRKLLEKMLEILGDKENE